MWRRRAGGHRAYFYPERFFPGKKYFGFPFRYLYTTITIIVKAAPCQVYEIS
jgi:hypothetical protein